MGYKLLGMFIWKGARWFLRRKYAAARTPKGVLAGGLLLVSVGILLATRQRTSGD
jgi:hypothetical protein